VHQFVLLGLSFGSVETGMNGSSHENHENRNLYDGLPPQGLSETRLQGVFLEFLVFNPPQGRPVGGGGIHRTRWIEWKQAQHHI
jgi:hypothetical protein